MVSNYIPRRLLEKEKYYSSDEYAQFLETYRELPGLVLSNKKRILLLGDAGYGKSTELRVLASKFITQQYSELIPIYIELNTYTNEEMIDYVRMKVGEDSITLLEEEKHKLLFLFDEFDQVLNKQEATRKLENFSQEYNESTIVIACRTNFYSGQFEEYDIYILASLNDDDIKKYAVKYLNDGNKNFLSEVYKYSLYELVKIPFFLNNLIQIYKADKKIPANRSSIYSRIISISLQKDEEKLNKFDLKQTYTSRDIEKDLRYLSVIMETLQRNFLSIDEFNSLFENPQKREVLGILTLIKKSFYKDGDVYQFQHNNFQEYLAADVLSNKNLSTILEFISYRSTLVEKSIISNTLPIVSKFHDLKIFNFNIGNIIERINRLISQRKIKKINPSWVNTVAFLCQIRYRKDLFDYLLKNQPELVIKFEKSSLDEDKREKIFKNIFEIYAEKKIWFDRGKIDIDALANFIDLSDNIYSYLIHYATNGEHFIQRYNAIEILGKMEGNNNNELKQTLIKIALDEKENPNVRDMALYALAWRKLNDKNTIDSLKELNEIDNDDVRSGYYYVIAESNLNDNYVDVLLEGVSLAVKSNLVDIGMYIESGLKKISSAEGIKKILEYFNTNPQRFRHHLVESILKSTIGNLSRAYETEPSLYDDIKKLLIIAYKNHQLHTLIPLRNFFKNTGTTVKIFKEFYEFGIENNYNYLGFIADEKCIKYIIQEYEEGKISDSEMQLFINSHSIVDEEEYNLNLSIINKQTGKFLPIPVDYFNKQEEKELKDYLNIIFSKKKYLSGIKNVFIQESRKELTKEDLREITWKRSNIKRVYNKHLLLDIRQMMKGSKKITFDDLQEKIVQGNIERFIIEKIYGFMLNTQNLVLTEKQINTIKNICLKYIENVDYKCALTVKSKIGVSSDRLLILLWFYLRKFEVKYSENVLLDLLSFDWVEGHSYVGIEYLEKLLSLDKITQRILENLKNGITIEPVLKNHIDFCKRHNLEETRQIMYAIAIDETIDIDNRLFALKTLACFRNTTSLLEKILECDTLKLFLESSKILLANSNDTVKKKLLKNLSSENEMLALESAKLLLDEQELKAIHFYIYHIMKTKTFNENFHNKSNLQRIKTIKALPLLIKLLKFSYEYDDQIKQDEYSTLKLAVINTLKNISSESYDNYIKVSKKLETLIKKNEKQLSDLNFLYGVIDDMERAALINFQSQITLNEAKTKFQKYLGPINRSDS